jgi:uncharacterized peroxidase-related enzyme
MTRTTIPTRDQAPVDSQPTLEGFEKFFGFVPNLFAVIGKSPNALAAFKGLQIPLQKTLDAGMRERIALAVSEVNGCEYCIRAHGFIGTRFGKLDLEEMELNRHGKSGDPKAEAAVSFAKKVTETRGKVTDDDLAAVREAGWSDAQIIEIIALSVQFLYTNFVNNVFQTEIDFPVVEAQEVVE